MYELYLHNITLCICNLNIYIDRMILYIYHNLMNFYDTIIDEFRFELIKEKSSVNKLEEKLDIVKGSIGQKLRNKTIKVTDMAYYLDAIGKKLIIVDK